MKKKILLGGCGIIVFFGGMLFATDAVRPLSYLSGLIEYYSGYCKAIDEDKIEEAFILLHPDLYAADEKNEQKRAEDKVKVEEELRKAIAASGRGTHEYKIILRAELGDYDYFQKAFQCAIANNTSCLDISPLQKEADAAGEADYAQSVIARGLLFNKVNKIKLFFSNAEEYSILKCPADEAKKFLKSRTTADGRVDRDIYVLMYIRILPGNNDAYRKMLDNIVQKIQVQGIESNYFMIARIERMEVYDDTYLKDKLGNVEKGYRTLQLQ